MKNETIKKQLVEIKLSIIENCSDTLWMRNADYTVCEEIDCMLRELGVSDEELELHGAK